MSNRRSWIAATIAAGPHADALASHAQREILSRLARIADDQLTIAPSVDADAQATALVVADATVYLTGMVDVAAERARLTRELEEASGHVERTRAQLANENFVARAKPEVVQGARDRLAAAEERVARVARAARRARSGVMDQAAAIRRHHVALWGPVCAITAAHGGEAGGQIAVGVLSASILPESPRVLIEIWKANRTHDLIAASGAFAVHPLAKEQADLVRQLGFRSGA